MKTLTAIAVVIAAVLLVGGIWLTVLSSKHQPGSSLSATSTSVSALPVTPDNPQKVSTSQNPAVVAAYLSQDKSASAGFVLGGTVVVMPYALQDWGDVNTGGEALLKYSASSGWTLITAGGGWWDVPDLVQEGVPQATAVQLMAGLGN